MTVRHVVVDPFEFAEEDAAAASLQGSGDERGGGTVWGKRAISRKTAEGRF